jgi:hypothetical protein
MARRSEENVRVMQHLCDTWAATSTAWGSGDAHRIPGGRSAPSPRAQPTWRACRAKASVANPFSAGPMGRLLERRERVLRRKERKAVFEVPVGQPQVRAKARVCRLGGRRRAHWPLGRRSPPHPRRGRTAVIPAPPPWLPSPRAPGPRGRRATTGPRERAAAVPRVSERAQLPERTPPVEGHGCTGGCPIAIEGRTSQRAHRTPRVRFAGVEWKSGCERYPNRSLRRSAVRMPSIQRSSSALLAAEMRATVSGGTSWKRRRA